MGGGSFSFNNVFYILASQGTFCPRTPPANVPTSKVPHPPSRLCRHFSDAAVGPNKSVCLCILTPPQHEWERTPQGVGALITPRHDGAKTVGELGLVRWNSAAQGWSSSDQRSRLA